MEILNSDTYSNSIYKAIVVNTNVSEDPHSANRVQIYIPYMQPSFYEDYKTYIDDSNKSSSPHRDKFPWAVTLVKDLKEGNEVYGSFVNNSLDNFIILGLDAYSIANQDNSSGSLDLSSSASGILDLAMPIIIHNEVGLNVNNWPDGITDAQYTDITPADNGGWSIGLIQWHEARAYDCCFEICKADANWESKFTDKNLDLFKDLKKSLAKNSDSSERGKYGSTFVPQVGGSIYNSVKNLLGSTEGKAAQKAYAEADTKQAIDNLINDYSIKNPAVIIWVADVMNQYGFYMTSLKDKASAICTNSSKGMLDQLYEVMDWAKSNIKSYNTYYSRRKTTKEYIEDLYNAGKLNDLSGVVVPELNSLTDVPETGDYLWPVPSSSKINVFWGERTMSIPYNFKYNTSRTVMGYTDFNRFHYGTDFGSSNGCDGDPVIAVGSGTVAAVTTGGVRHSGSIGNWTSDDGPTQGNAIAIKMDKNPNHYFVYMHLCKAPQFKVGDKVKAGEVVGYMGSTGRSTGTHLHLGLHIGAPWPAAERETRIDPLPYLGKQMKL